MSYGEDISVFHDIFLAFKPPRAGLFCLRKGALTGNEVIIVDDLGTDEFVEEIRMDYPRGLLCRSARLDSPCPALVLADSEERVKAQKGIRPTSAPGPLQLSFLLFYNDFGCSVIDLGKRARNPQMLPQLSREKP